MTTKSATTPRLNEPEPELTAEERKQLGARFRALRAERRAHQRNGAKAADLSVGTVQAIERGVDSVRVANLAKLARAFDTTLPALLGSVARTTLVRDPLRELNAEHIAIAYAYRNARRAIRESVEVLLLDADRHEHLTELVVRDTAMKIPPHSLILEALLDETCGPFLAFMVRVLDQFRTDPSILAYLDTHLKAERRGSKPPR